MQYISISRQCLHGFGYINDGTLAIGVLPTLFLCCVQILIMQQLHVLSLLISAVTKQRSLSDSLIYPHLFFCIFFSCTPARMLIINSLIGHGSSLITRHPQERQHVIDSILTQGITTETSTRSLLASASLAGC